ncbi:unnamed protein product, partial [Discosporangium mesarthrocarpum]
MYGAIISLAGIYATLGFELSGWRTPTGTTTAISGCTRPPIPTWNSGHSSPCTQPRNHWTRGRPLLTHETTGGDGDSTQLSAFGVPEMRRWSSSPGLPDPDMDALHMQRALELAAQGVGKTRPNPAVGCIILDKDGEVVGEGFHPKAGEPHAEIWALRQAGRKSVGGTVYVTLEPCNHHGRTPPCTSALLASGVRRVVAGMVDPDPRTAGGGLRRLAEAGVEVTVGVEEDACRRINAPFVHRIVEKSCYGVLYCAVTGEELADCHRSPSLLLEDTSQEMGSVAPPGRRGFAEHDAIVVEGQAGVSKLEALIRGGGLAPTLLLVVAVVSGKGLGEELGPTLGSELWRSMPDRTVVVLASKDGDSE